MIFETHAHYDDEVFNEDRDLLLSEMNQQGIEYIVNVGASIATSENTIELTKEYPFVFGSVGVHPDETKELDEDKFLWLRQASALPKIIAIGEIGLDYYWDSTEKQIQKTWFERQMELAREVKLPMIVHSRDAASDTLTMIRAVKGGEIGGVIHCFSYGIEMAREYLNMGFYLGIGGVLTFKNAKKLKEVVDYAPLDQLVLETDAPYLAPVPYRGKRNNSMNLTYVAEEIARIKGTDPLKVMEITKANAKKMYGIK